MNPVKRIENINKDVKYLQTPNRTPKNKGAKRQGEKSMCVYSTHEKVNYVLCKIPREKSGWKIIPITVGQNQSKNDSEKYYIIKQCSELEQK